VKEQTAAQLRKEFSEKIFTVPSADNMELLAFMVAYAVEDYAEDFLTFGKSRRRTKRATRPGASRSINYSPI